MTLAGFILFIGAVVLFFDGHPLLGIFCFFALAAI
jgi:hypothetical protein